MIARIVLCIYIVGIMIALSACTSHTRYYTTDGTRTTEIERTTHVGATPPAPLVRGVQDDVSASTDPVGAELRVCPEMPGAPSTDPALPPDTGGQRGVQ